ncbi:MAG: AEC family transporter [Thermodesulfobacteriota bacterium]
MTGAFATLIPVFAVILTGLGLRLTAFPGREFWPAAERLTYFILFPALLLQSTATAAYSPGVFPRLALALLLATCIMVGLLFLLRPRLTASLPSFSSVVQGSIRFNTYVGFSISLAMAGREGLAAASLVIAILIPLVNLFSVVTLAMASGRTSPARLLLTVARTPPFLACLLGLAINGSGISLPETVGNLLSLFGRASLPLGLLAVGASLHWQGISRQPGIILFSSATKLAGFPLLIFAIGSLAGLPDGMLAQAVLFGALPGSASSYILAKQLGGDHELMAAIITGQTAASLLTLPVVLALLPL